MDAPIREKHRKSLVNRLRRVEGQLRGVQAMIEKEADCTAIAQQLAAARRALDRAFFEMVGCALQSEVAGASSLDAVRDVGAGVTDLLVKYG